MSEFDVAVIGLSCRFPGAADPDSFWRNMVAGVCSIRRHSRAELLRHGVSPKLVDAPEYVPVDGFLEDADAFDATFFGISEREATLTDPQHRLFLECAWAALEDAGHSPQSPAAVVGCFAAAGMSLYAGARMSSYLTEAVLADTDLVEGSAVPLISVANRGDYLATRVAFQLGLRGPAINVQTACSSALVATHLAIQSLLSGECDMALAGAAAVHVPVACGYLHQNGGILSPSGRCLPFDADADGTVGGNGVGVVVLKRYADAVAAGDPIRAVITGSAINNDGRDKSSFAAPGMRGQREVIAAAHTLSGRSPQTIGLAETHGTGTRLGDPIEIRSLRAVLDGDDRNRCAIGAVKANIGHLDTAAGVAGLIKVVLAVQRGVIPPVAGFRRLNPEIDLADSRLYVPTVATPWPGPDGSHRRAAVSSFGAGGTNAHLVVEQAPSRQPRQSRGGGRYLIAVSARDGEALRDSALRLADRLRGTEPVALADVSLTSLAGRAPLRANLSVVAATTAEAADRLATAAESVDTTTQLTPAAAGPVTLLFPGQGGEGWSVLHRWLAVDEDFQGAFGALHQQARPRLDADLTELIGCADDPRRGQAANLQPALVAAAIALAQTLTAAGVRPALVIGHSLGELAAAAIAGVFSPVEAVVLAGTRGRLMDQRCAGGAMAVAVIDAGGAAAAIDAAGATDVAVAVINSEHSVVLSGPHAQLTAVCAALRARDVRTTPLGTTHAFHSPMMESIVDDVAAAAAAAKPGAPAIPMLSTVTGRIGSEVADPAYWGRQVRDPVFFGDAVGASIIPTGTVFVDLSPSGVLAEIVAVNRPALADRLVRLDRHDQAPPSARLLLGLRDRGVPVDWSGTALHRRAHRIALPAYPFRRTTYWPRRDAAGSAAALRPVRLASVVWTPLDADTSAVDGRCPVVLAPRAGAAAVDAVRNQVPGCRTVPDWDELLRTDLARATRVLEKALQSADGIVDLTALGGADTADATDPARDWISLRSTMAVAAASPQVPVVTLTVGGADVPGSTSGRPDQAAVWGFVRSARAESPGPGWRLVDCDSTVDAATLRAEIVRTDHSEIALRNTLRLAPLLIDAPDTSGEASPTGLTGPLDTVVIGGGTGGIAARMIQRCARNGARRVVLVARNPPGQPPAGPPGCVVEFARADLAVPADVERLARSLPRGSVSLVIAAAGVLRDAIASRVTESDLRAVLAPKVLGTAALARLAAEHGCPMLVMSSLASLLGSPGQAAYAAANAALESLSRAAGPAVTTVAWGPWQQVGMSRELDPRSGPRALPADQWLDALDRVPMGGATYYALPDPVVAEGDSGLMPRPEALAAQVWAEPGVHDAAARTDQWREAVAGGEITGFVCRAVAALLRRDSVAVDAPLVDLGLDSLAGLRLRRDLMAATGIDLPPTLIYDYPHCAALAAHLAAVTAPGDGQAPHNDSNGSIAELGAELKRELARSLEAL
ncbi:type I polyketide synthase [Mycobacterium persicum]|uniref:type I polyketide synthase n=1 Tax=Mycobacterium persicum TaxID=1487726 RepID=UPI000C0761FA|nr:type I polyketide synthase [Mycobacterium persicum]